MEKTGLLSQQNGDSSVDGTLLARRGASDPFGAATDFLAARGLVSGNRITVTGEDGTIGGASVFFMASAVKTSQSLVARKRSARKGGKKSGKKRGKKKPHRAAKRKSGRKVRK